MRHTKLSKLQKIIIQELSVPQPQYMVSRKISKQIPNARKQWDCKPFTHRCKRHHDIQTDAFKSSFSRSLKRLHKRGLIQISTSFHDRYMFEIRLTDEGYFVLETIKQNQNSIM